MQIVWLRKEPQLLIKGLAPKQQPEGGRGGGWWSPQPSFSSSSTWYWLINASSTINNFRNVCWVGGSISWLLLILFFCISNIYIFLRLAGSFVTELKGWGLGETAFQEQSECQTRAKGRVWSAECLCFLLITDITNHSTRRVEGKSESWVTGIRVFPPSFLQIPHGQLIRKCLEVEMNFITPKCRCISIYASQKLKKKKNHPQISEVIFFHIINELTTEFV